jgi:hypothetical protein
MWVQKFDTESTDILLLTTLGVMVTIANIPFNSWVILSLVSMLNMKLHFIYIKDISRYISYIINTSRYQPRSAGGC